MQLCFTPWVVKSDIFIRSYYSCAVFIIAKVYITNTHALIFEPGTSILETKCNPFKRVKFTVYINNVDV